MAVEVSSVAAATSSGAVEVVLSANGAVDIASADPAEVVDMGWRRGDRLIFFWSCRAIGVSSNRVRVNMLGSRSYLCVEPNPVRGTWRLAWYRYNVTMYTWLFLDFEIAKK